MTNGFKIIGISVRTTNKDNKASQDLSQLWSQFYAENLLEKIPNKASNAVLSIYTDYKSDFTDEYTTFIGVSVTTLDEIPKGLTRREFKADNFQKFVAKGEMPQAVVNTWVNIWQNDKNLNRKYNYDFEVYGDKSQIGENSEVEIYIGVE